LQLAVERRDRRMLEGRIERLRWLNKIHPAGGFLMPSESYAVFEEARGTYLDGHFVGTLILGLAFVEHRFSSLLKENGFDRESRAGMRDMIKALRAHDLVEGFLLDHADRLRHYRNPFVH
jgi:hypothetical protein